MNWFAAILIAVGGCLSGLYLSYRLKRREQLLVLIMLMLEDMMIYIRFRAPKIISVLKHCAESGSFKELAFIENTLELTGTDGNFHESWTKSVQAFQGINENDKSILISLGDKLGQSNLEGQTEIIEMHIALIKRQLELAGEESKSKGKMLRSVGTLCGVALGIMIL